MANTLLADAKPPGEWWCCLTGPNPAGNNDRVKNNVRKTVRPRVMTSDKGEGKGWLGPRWMEVPDPRVSATLTPADIVETLSVKRAGAATLCVYATREKSGVEFKVFIHGGTGDSSVL